MAKKTRRSIALCPELLEQVLALLPAEKVMETKAVCRAWRDLIASSRFRAFWKSMEAKRSSSISSSCVIKYRYASRKLSRCYSSGVSKWCNVANSYFMPQNAFLVKQCNRSLVASRSDKDIFVGNPVTGRWTSFKPPMLMRDWYSKEWTLMAVASTEDDATPRFQMYIGDLMYDSRFQHWKLVTLPTSGGVYGSIHADGMSCFHYLCQYGRRRVQLMKGRVTEEGGCRTEVVATSKLVYPQQHRLIDYRDEVGMISANDTSVVIMALEPASQEWVLKSSMPASLLDRLGNAELKFTGGTGRLTFVSAEAGLVMFDSQDDSWQWVEDPVTVEPFDRKWQLFCLELSFLLP